MFLAAGDLGAELQIGDRASDEQLVGSRLGRPGVGRAVPVSEVAVANGDDSIHRFPSRRLDSRRTHQPAWSPLNGAVWSAGVQLHHFAAEPRA